MLYGFQDFPEMLKHDGFYESSYIAQCRPGCAVSKAIMGHSLHKKLEIREYYATLKNYRLTQEYLVLKAQLFKVTSTEKTNKGRFGGLKGSKGFKVNKKRSKKGSQVFDENCPRNFSLSCRNDGFPSSYLSLATRKFIKSKTQPHFKGWIQKGSQAHGPALRRLTSVR